MPVASVLDLIGQTPLVEITLLDTGPCRLFLKLEPRAVTTYASVPAEIRAAFGIDDGLVRLAVGIEEAADLITDLRSAPE
jgi:hypothetical protein